LRDLKRARRKGKIHNALRGAFEHVPHSGAISHMAKSPDFKKLGLSKYTPSFVTTGKYTFDGLDREEDEVRGQMKSDDEAYESGESGINFPEGPVIHYQSKPENNLPNEWEGSLPEMSDDTFSEISDDDFLEGLPEELDESFSSESGGNF